MLRLRKLVPFIACLLILYLIYKLTPHYKHHSTHSELSIEYKFVKENSLSISGFLHVRNLLNSSSAADERGVTLVSQCSHNQLHHIVRLKEAWQGPMSVAVFSDNADLTDALHNILLVQSCSIPHLHLHLVSPHVVDEPGEQHLDIQEASFELSQPFQCSPDSFVKSGRNYAMRTPYPVNLLRNVAKRAATTAHILVVDMDMVPSQGLALALAAVLLGPSSTSRALLVVPAFEMAAAEGRPPPRDKAELLGLAARGVVRPFYSERCDKCQAPTDYPRWLALPPSQGVHTAYSVLWRDPWEPFYVASKAVPDYDERFKQYGFNRISQVCEAHVAGFEFHVLDNAFLVHEGFKADSQFHRTKEREQEDNRMLFRRFKQELKGRYAGTRRRC